MEKHRSDPDLTTTATAPTETSPLSLERGATFGRYLVLERLGEGGMGVVYSAYDPELDRKVAVKILRLEASHNQARLRREAQAMARLQHPNVVAVFDVGTFRQSDFVAMELVAGTTLSSWLDERPPGTAARTWREILDVFVQAGRGLAAAHAVGLVHRDFKPANVLMGLDGRARVADFGVARSLAGDDGRPGAAANERTPDQPSPLLHAKVTQTGSLIGTPAYMSPEQFLGRPADARSDQFSFCVALYRALYGERPFAGESAEEIGAEVTAGRLRAPPRDSRVPAWVRDAVMRGLATDGNARWPSMDALLAALTRDPARVRHLRLAGAVAIVALCAVVLGVRALERRQSLVCRGAERKLAGVWDEARKRTVHAAFGATGLPYAETAYATVVRALDDFQQSWVAMHTDACEATRVRREQSEELLDLRMQCLASELQKVGAQIDLFADADAKVVQRAAEMVAKTPRPSECSDVAALRAPVRPPADPATRARVDELRRKLAKAEALDDAGKHQEALAIATTAATEAHALKYGPLEAQAKFRLGDIQKDAAAPKTAEQTLLDAALIARASGDAMTEYMSWRQLVWVYGNDPRRYEQAHFRARLARAALDALGSDEPTARARLLYNEAMVLSDEGKHAQGLDNLRQALAIDEKTLGPDSRAVGWDLQNMASDLGMLGRWNEAESYSRRALTVMEKQSGPEHDDYAYALFQVGFALCGQGRFEEALPYYLRNLAILEKTLGPEHPHITPTLNNIGTLLEFLGRWDEALPYYERALAICEKTKGAEHPDVALALANIGEVLRHAGRYDEAMSYHRRAIPIFEKAFPNGCPFLAATLAYEGHVDLDRHRANAALPPLERALAMWGRLPPGDPSLPAETRFTLARALWESGRDRVRARELATRARAGYAEAGAASKEQLAEVDSWLSSHR